MGSTNTAITTKSLRHWWQVRTGNVQYFHDGLLDELLPRLTDLRFVERHAELGLIHELIAHYQRLLTAFEQLHRSASSPPLREESPLWLRDCVTATIEGKSDPYPDLGSGPTLSTLLRELEKRDGRNPPDAAVFPDTFNLQLSRCGDPEVDNAIPLFASGDRVDAAFFEGLPNSADMLDSIRTAEQVVDTLALEATSYAPLHQLRALVSFAGGNSHFLEAHPNETIPVAYNLAASGILHSYARSLVPQLHRPWFAREPRPPGVSDRPLLFRTLVGHSKGIEATAISGDASILVSGGEDHTVRVWEIATGKCVHVLSGHAAPAELVAITQNGTRAVSCARDDGRDTSWRLWDVINGICLGHGNVHGPTIDAIAISGDGRIIVTVGGCAVTVWDATWASCLRRFGDSSNVNGSCLTITPDSKMGATSFGTRISVWELASGRIVRELSGHDHFVRLVAFSANGRVLASASQDDCIRVWETASGRCLREILVPPDGMPLGMSIDGCQGITHLCLSADGRIAATASEFSRFVRIWDLTTGECIRTLKEDLSFPRGLALASNATLGVSAHGENLRVWDIAGGKRSRSLPHYANPVTQVAMSRNGQCVISLAESDPVVWWDAITGKIRYQHSDVYENGYPVGFTDATITTDGQSVAVCGDRRRLMVIDATEGDLKWLRTSEYADARLTFCPCNEVLVSSDRDRTGFSNEKMNRPGGLNIWSIRTGDWLRQCRDERGGFMDHAPLPDGRRIVAIDRQGNIGLWDWMQGESVRSIQGTPNENRHLELHPGGSHVATMGSSSSFVIVWSLLNGRRILVLDAVGEDITDISFTPDGRRLLVGSSQGTVCVCELSSGVFSHTIKTNAGAVSTLRPSVDGSCCAVVGENQELQFWDLRTGELLAVYHSGSPRSGHLPGNRWRLLSDFHPNGHCVLGTPDGYVHFLTLAGFREQIPRVTAGQLWRARLVSASKQSILNVEKPLFRQGEPIPGERDAVLTAACAWCGSRVQPSDSVIAKLAETTASLNLTATDYAPWLHPPISTAEESQLVCDCDCCGKPLQFNPFIVWHE